MTVCRSPAPCSIVASHLLLQRGRAVFEWGMAMSSHSSLSSGTQDWPRPMSWSNMRDSSALTNSSLCQNAFLSIFQSLCATLHCLLLNLTISSATHGLSVRGKTGSYVGLDVTSFMSHIFSIHIAAISTGVAHGHGKHAVLRKKWVPIIS